MPASQIPALRQQRTPSRQRVLAPFLSVLAALTVLAPLPARAQRGTFSIGAGYTFLHTNLLPGCNCFGLQGGSAEAQLGLTRHLSLLGDVTVTPPRQHHPGRLRPYPDRLQRRPPLHPAAYPVFSPLATCSSAARTPAAAFPPPTPALAAATPSPSRPAVACSSHSPLASPSNPPNSVTCSPPSPMAPTTARTTSASPPASSSASAANGSQVPSPPKAQPTPPAPKRSSREKTPCLLPTAPIPGLTASLSARCSSPPSSAPSPVWARSPFPPSP